VLRPFAGAEEVLVDMTRSPVIEWNTRFKYSNHGYALLGLVIEAVTGEPDKSWIRREIVVPCGLQETEPDMPLPPVRHSHAAIPESCCSAKRLVVLGDYQVNAIAPAGGFVSTAADPARFFDMSGTTSIGRGS